MGAPYVYSGFPCPCLHPCVVIRLTAARTELGGAGSRLHWMPGSWIWSRAPRPSVCWPGQQLSDYTSVSEGQRGQVSIRQLQQEPCFPGSASPFAHSPHVVILTWCSSHHPVSPRPQPALKSVPCSGLISIASPCTWPLMLHGHLKLNRSETTHFQTLKTAFLSCVPSHR